MKKETIFRHELNESIQAKAALNCLKNRNKHQQNEGFLMTAGIWVLKKIVFHLVMKAIKKYGSQIDFSKVMDSVANGLAEQKGALQKAVGKAVNGWQDLPEKYKNQITELAKEKFNELKSAAGEKINQLTSKGQPQLANQEQEEETTDEKSEFALKLVKKFKNKMTPDYAKRPEMFMMLKLQNALKKPLMSLSKEEYHAWAKAICDACESVFGSQEQEELTVEQEEDTLNAYYSQDEPDYENDHHGIWLIINLMRKMGMLRAKGIEGRDDVDDGHAINAAYDLIEQKLNDEGMWIGDDDHEAERFVSFFGEEIAEEAMKSAIHNQKVDDMEGSRKEYYSQDEPDYDDDSHGIRLILNMLMKRGDITKNDVPRVQKQIKSMLDAEGMWIGDDENEAERFIEMIWDNQEQEEMPSMERHDMILALSEYMSESWIATDDGDLDELYYAVAEVLDRTGDYPASTKWEDCKPWCQKHYREVEETFLGGGF